MILKIIIKNLIYIFLTIIENYGKINRQYKLIIFFILVLKNL